MKIFRKVLCMILAVMMMATAFSAMAFAEEKTIIDSGYCGAEGDGSNLKWTLDSEGTLTISGTGAMKDYSIEYVDYSYITTAPWGNRSLNTLVLDDGITYIGKYAFKGCFRFSFRGYLIIPNSVTFIGDSAFADCMGITGNLILPDNIKSIGSNAFARCSGFTGSLSIPYGISAIEGYAFSECRGLTGNLVIPNSVTSIKEGAFKDSGISGNLIIPDSVTFIGGSAFYNCEVTVYFMGDAPDMGGGYDRTFSDVNYRKKTLYYIEGKSGWTSPTWYDYITATWIPESEPICNHKNTELKNAKEANCVTEGYTGDTYCKDCGALVKSGEKIQKNTQKHTGNTEVRNEKAATCAAEGYTGDTYCKDCGELVKNGTAIPENAQNHVGGTEIKDAKKATCAAEGYTGDIYCKDCSELVKKGEATQKNVQNHVGGTEVKDVKKANCVDEGYTGDTYCKGCGIKLSDGQKIAVDPENHKEIEVINKKDATCKDAGYTGDTRCKACDTVIAKGTEIAKTENHKFGEWKVVKEATKSEEGLKERVCSVCNKVETAKIAKLNDKDSESIHISVNGESKGEKNPNTGAEPIIGMAVLAAVCTGAYIASKKRH